jgi:hypothetical protein
MTRLRFHEILLLSESEKSARRIPFKNLVTVIKGENDRGKSCLIKSLYMAFGATPKKVHPNWKNLKVIIQVHFEVDGTHYRILRNGKHFTLFDANKKALWTHSSVTRGLGPELAKLFNFRLHLTNSQTKETQQATPAFLFLPFYFDQDGSWTESWDSFESLRQFKQYRQAIAAFHTGLRPNEYYDAKARRSKAIDLRDSLRKDRDVINRVLEKIETLTKDSTFDLSVTNYQAEVSELLAQCNELRKNEEKLRDDMIELENHRVLIARQMDITEQAAQELSKDFAYAAEKLDDDVECPTCGQHYENSFAERFGIAADEDKLRALLLQLTEEHDNCTRQIERKQKLKAEVVERLSNINELLEVKQGEVQLKDILRSEGKKEIRVVLRKELNDLNQKIGEADGAIGRAEDAMRSVTAKDRVREIKEFYLARMSVHLSFLKVTELTEDGYKHVHSKITENGSDGPRALLAFYFAILKTIEKYSTTTRCPIVIDSPNQQDQDKGNWKNILTFIRDQRPPEAQMIVGLVNDEGISLGGDVIELKDERQLLQKSQFDSVMAYLRPFIDKAIQT